MDQGYSLAPSSPCPVEAPPQLCGAFALIWYVWQAITYRPAPTMARNASGHREARTLRKPFRSGKQTPGAYHGDSDQQDDVCMPKLRHDLSTYQSRGWPWHRNSAADHMPAVRSAVQWAGREIRAQVSNAHSARSQIQIASRARRFVNRAGEWQLISCQRSATDRCQHSQIAGTTGFVTRMTTTVVSARY